MYRTISNNNVMNKETICVANYTIKLSYDTIVHKKVFNADIAIALPEGIKCLCYVYKDVVEVFELDKDKRRITNSKQFSNNLNHSVNVNKDNEYLFYGTLFHHNKQTCFSIEDIYGFNQQNIFTRYFLDKLKIIKAFLDLCTYTSLNIYNETPKGVPQDVHLCKTADLTGKGKGNGYHALEKCEGVKKF